MPTIAKDRRPTLVTFAAVITFIVAALYGVIALNEFSSSSWLITGTHGTYNIFHGHYFWWGVADGIVALIAFGSAISMLRGGFFGLFFGCIGAGISMLRWLFYIPASPVLAIVIIVIDAVVIYALVSSFDYFADSVDL